MWEVKDEDGYVRGKHEDLNIAMEMAKYIDEFVTITNGTMQIVGKFGCEEVKNGLTPDGKVYDWTMRRDETHRSSRKKLV